MREALKNIQSYHIYLLNFVLHIIGVYVYRDVFTPDGVSDPVASFFVQYFGRFVPFIVIGILGILMLVTVPYFYLGFLSRTLAVVYVVIGLVALYYLEEMAMVFGVLVIVGAFVEFQQPDRSAEHFWVNQD